ncbi:MAG: PKD domain-containing protein [Acidobacteriaceae bacterium]
MGINLIRRVPVGNVAGMLAGIIFVIFGHLSLLNAQNREQGLQVKIDPVDGSYTVGVSDSDPVVLKADVAVQSDGRWLESRNYPKHAIMTSRVEDDLGTAEEWTATFSDLPGEPDLIYRLRAYPNKPFADIQVFVHNSTAKSIQVESIRSIAGLGNSILDLGGPVGEDRVLSDSFSESRANFTISDLANTKDPMQRGFGSQLIYNRQSHTSFFAGALTSNRFLTVLRIHVAEKADQPQIASYEVDSTGTTEAEEGDSPQQSSSKNLVPLKLLVAPGTELASERLLLSVSTDYYRQLETYASVIQQLHHARVTAPASMGWWSWTAYYYGLNEGTALTNAQWVAQNLKPLGYDFFHIDEGYQYARGEYITPNATLFPHGMASLEQKIRDLGLIPAIWTAPFEVSNRSWVYQNHPDWLVHNAKGDPIHIGSIGNSGEQLFALDCTNPGAQEYLQKTYSTMVKEWGIRCIKLDFMDASAIEGHYYRLNTSAMEAQRIGLGIIRDTVGNHVLLDKDGSVMLNPVGYVDFGRISQDTGHTFQSSKEAASEIAARYYMNRKFFVADPDAFTVSKQFVKAQVWHGGTRPLTLDEAKVSIAVAAISGGMYEIGDDLPILGAEPERLALVENQDLIDMVRLGQASTPLDLMTYLPEDEQPSIFLLKEDARQSMLTIFDWTDHARTHTISISGLGLTGRGPYTAYDVLDKKKIPVQKLDSLVVHQPAHSVRVLKIIDTGVLAAPPAVQAQHPSSADAGATVEFAVHLASPEIAAVSYRWDFGDGVTQQGEQVSHAYTHAGTYKVQLIATGLDGLKGQDTFHLRVTGSIPTQFVPAENRRYPIHH